MSGAAARASVALPGPHRPGTPPLPGDAPVAPGSPGYQRYRVEVRSGGTIAFRIPLWQKMAVGGLSGVLGTCVVFPVDFVKTNVQLQSASGATARSVIRDTLRGQGVRGLYAGIAPTLVGVMPEKALKLGVNDYLRDLFCGYDRSQETLLNQVVAGALTGIVQVMATNPMEIVKLRMQSAEPVSTTTATTHSTPETSLGAPLRSSAMIAPLRRS